MYGNWRLVNGSELYNTKYDPGQKNNIINENKDIANAMHKFYEDWWEDASKEFKYSYIDIYPNITNYMKMKVIYWKVKKDFME